MTLKLNHLKDHIKTLLTSNKISSKLKLQDFISLLEDNPDVSPILTKEGFSFLKNYILKPNNIQPELKDQSGYINKTLEYEFFDDVQKVKKWGYQDLYINEIFLGCVVKIPEKIEPEKTTTQIQGLLIALWLQKENFSQNRKELEKHGAIIVWDRNCQEGSPEIKQSFLSLTLPEYNKKQDSYSPKWNSHQKFNISESSQLLNPTRAKSLGRLIISSFKPQAPRWRFVSFYRVFENGLIFALLEKINNEFMEVPSKVISEAKDALDSEEIKLYELAVQHKLEDLFSNFYRKASILAKTNTYAKDITDIAHQKLGEIIKNPKADSIKKLQDIGTKQQKAKARKRRKALSGICVLYKIRCSIVHAGENKYQNPPIENYNDADDFIEVMLPFLEDAIFKYAQIELK